MVDRGEKQTKGLKFVGYIFMPDAKDDYDGLREYSTNLVLQRHLDYHKNDNSL